MFVRGERSLVALPVRDQHATPCPTFSTNPADIESSFNSPVLKFSLTRPSHSLFLSAIGFSGHILAVALLASRAYLRQKASVTAPPPATPRFFPSHTAP